MKHILINEHDLSSLLNFRRQLLCSLLEGNVVSVLYKYDFFDRIFEIDQVELRSLHAVGRFKFFPIFMEVLERSTMFSREKYDVELVIGLRTGLVRFPLLIFNNKKTILLVPGIGRVGGLGIFFKKLVYWSIKYFYTKKIFLNEHDFRALATQKNECLVLASEGIDLRLRGDLVSSKGRKLRNRLIYLGRILKDKGIHSLAIKFSGNFHLDIYGYGQDQAILELEEICRENCNVNYLGATKKPLEVMSRYAYAIFPSTYNEGFPIVILEAITAGCIPIIIRIEQIHHLTSRVPELRTLTPNYSMQELNEIIEFYSNNPDLVECLRNKLTDYVVTYHDRDQVCEKIIKFLQI